MKTVAGLSADAIYFHQALLSTVTSYMLRFSGQLLLKMRAIYNNITSASTGGMLV